MNNNTPPLFPPTPTLPARPTPAHGAATPGHHLARQRPAGHAATCAVPCPSDDVAPGGTLLLEEQGYVPVGASARRCGRGCPHVVQLDAHGAERWRLEACDRIVEVGQMRKHNAEEWCLGARQGKNGLVQVWK
eukprot:363648-Chlamydomonas_euryale.AAC.3